MEIHLEKMLNINWALIVLISDPLPPNQQAISWLELVLRDRQMTFQAMMGDRSITILVQNPAYMAQIIKKGLDHVIEVLGMWIWKEALTRIGMAGNINITNSLELGALMGHNLSNVPFFPFYPYLPSDKTCSSYMSGPT